MVSVALLVARRTNNRKVVGSIPANAVCFTVDRPVVNCPLWPATTPSSELSALMDSDLALVNGKSAR